MTAEQHPQHCGHEPICRYFGIGSGTYCHGYKCSYDTRSPAQQPDALAELESLKEWVRYTAEGDPLFHYTGLIATIEARQAAIRSKQESTKDWTVGMVCAFEAGLKEGKMMAQQPDALELLEEWDYYNNRNFLTPHPVFADMIRLVREKPDEVREHLSAIRSKQGGGE